MVVNNIMKYQIILIKRIGNDIFFIFLRKFTLHTRMGLENSMREGSKPGPSLFVSGR